MAITSCLGIEIEAPCLKNRKVTTWKIMSLSQYRRTSCFKIEIVEPYCLKRSNLVGEPRVKRDCLHLSVVGHFLLWNKISLELSSLNIILSNLDTYPFQGRLHDFLFLASSIWPWWRQSGPKRRLRQPLKGIRFKLEDWQTRRAGWIHVVTFKSNASLPTCLAWKPSPPCP